MRLLECGLIAESFRIEDDYVSVISRLEVASLRELQDVRGQTAGAANGVFQGNDLILDGIAADLAGKAAVTPRVRHRVGGHLRGPVAGGGHKRLLHDQRHILRTHAEVDDLSAAMKLDVENRIQKIRLFLSGDRIEGLALPGGIGLVSGDVDVRSGIQTDKLILNRLADFGSLDRIA